MFVTVRVRKQTHTHTLMHRQEEQRAAEAHIQYIQIQVSKQKLFLYQREEYKTALPQCVLEKLYGVTTALEKKQPQRKHKMWDKKVKRIILQSLLES